jgi:glycosyltransferase involved in cell wall biosynthesis
MRKIVIISTSIDDWGGSEELWGRSIPFFQKAGFEITVMKSLMDRNHPELKKLNDLGVKLLEIDREKSVSKKAVKLVSKFLIEISIALKLSTYGGESFKNFRKLLQQEKADLVIISQGINFDGLKLAGQCLHLNIPYVVVSQKAVDFYWPEKSDRISMVQTLLKAKQTYFVSKHNLRLTEEQFGKRLPNAKVVFNPVKLSGKRAPYPKSTLIYKFACVGRLFLLDKGQDILIRILAEEKWKNRPISVSFIGKGPDDEALKDLAKLLNVTNIEFKGQVDDIENMWGEYHALLLPSRCEGLPLSMVEAMSAGRPVIISDVGGNTELVNEGLTGFIGYPNEESFGDAMERAWDKKDDWEEIGKNASKYISEVVPEKPEQDFASSILKLLKS